MLASLLPAFLMTIAAGSICAGQDLTATSSAPASYTLDVYALRGPSDTHATLYIGVYPISSQTAAPATLKDVLTQVTKDGNVEGARDYQSVASPGGMATVDLGNVPLLDTVQVQVVVQTSETVAAQVLQGQTAVTQFALNPRQVVISDFEGYGAQFNQNLYGQISNATYTNYPPEDPTNVEAKVKDMHPGLSRIFLSSWAYPGGNNYNPSMIASFYKVIQLAQASGAQVEVNWVSITHPPSATTDDAEKPFIDSDMQTFADTINDLVKNYGITAIKWLAIQNEPSSVKWLNADQPDFPMYKYAYEDLENDLAAYGIRDQFKYMGDGLELNSHEPYWYNYMSTQMNDLLDGWSEHIYWNYFDQGKITSRLQGIVNMVQGVKDAGHPVKPLFVTEYGVRGVKTYNGVALKDADPYQNGKLVATQAGYYINPDGTLTPVNETNVAAWEQAEMNMEAVNDGFVGLSKWDFYHAQYDFGYQDHSLIGYNFSPLEGQDQWPLRPAYYMEWLMAHTADQHAQVLGQHGSADTLLITPFRNPSGDLTLFGTNSDYNATTAADISVGDLPANTTFNVLVWNSDGSGKVTNLGTIDSGPSGFVSFSAPAQGLVALTTSAAPSLP